MALKNKVNSIFNGEINNLFLINIDSALYPPLEKNLHLIKKLNGTYGELSIFC